MDAAKALGTPRYDLRGVALLLAGGMCLVPFLQPRHLPPLRAFYDEWFAFAIFTVALGLVAVSPARAKFKWPAPALCLVLFSLTLIGRLPGGESAYSQSPLVWAIYALFAALVIALGHELSCEFGRERVCDVLAMFILAGALANSIFAALQTVGTPHILSSFIANRAGIRATGNVGQANLFANYVALGQASLVYLYARGKFGVIPALACGFLLVCGAAMATSRASTLYACGFAFLGYLAIRAQKDAQARRLGIAAFVLLAGVALAQWTVPAALSAAGYRTEGGVFRNTPADWEGSLPDEAANLRLSAWAMAIKLFQDAPWLGVGPDEFPGAAFARGLPPELAGDLLWTSPHNLVLHLLSESGLVGASLVGAAVLLWLRGALREFARLRDASLWWLLACAGVELLHALLEYPLWYAHFLSITALLMGVSSAGGIAVRPLIVRVAFGLSAVAGATLLALSLGAYLKFDLASPVAAGRSLAVDSEIARDRASLAELGHSLLAPRAETWLFLAFPLDESGLAEKIRVGSRVMRVWPAREVIVRQAIFLALVGRTEEAKTLLEQSLRTFPGRKKAFLAVIQTAPPRARATLEPLLLGN